MYDYFDVSPDIKAGLITRPHSWTEYHEHATASYRVRRLGHQLCPCETRAMPQYEFRCRACGSTFVQTRPMSASAEPASCPAGHDDTVRLLSLGGVTGRAQAPAPSGGCCGGGCCG